MNAICFHVSIECTLSNEVLHSHYMQRAREKKTNVVLIRRRPPKRYWHFITTFAPTQEKSLCASPHNNVSC